MRTPKKDQLVELHFVMIAAIFCFLLTACVALMRNDSVRAHFGSSLFHIDLETQRHQPSASAPPK